MATRQSDGVNPSLQAHEIDLAGHHGGRYRDYLRARAKVATMPANASDEAFDAAMDEADRIFDDLMEECPGSIASVMLKARASHHWAMLRSEGSVMSPRILAELFGIIAADLEILLTGPVGERARKPAAARGKAVRS
jgi:hypothetical protein